MVEALVNTAIGFCIALAGQVFITRYYGIATTFQQDFLITCFFTGISILRGYAVRRLFNSWHHYQPIIKRRLGAVVCYFKGHDYQTLDFRDNALYFCARCRKEILDRTLDDLRNMRPMDDDELEDMHRQIAMEAQP
jgi:hypothetical protein